MIHTAIACSTACCRIRYLSCPGGISSKPVAFPGLELYTIISPLLQQLLLCSCGQVADSQQICSIRQSGAGEMWRHQ